MKPCPSCNSRAWREIGGFLVLHCAVKNLRLGIQPDIERGHVNKAGGCVAMPKQCVDYKSGLLPLPPLRGKVGMGV